MMMDMSPSIEHKGSKRREVPPILQIGKTDPFYLEQFKALRARIEFLVDQRNIKVIAVTSAIAGEGKTLSSVKLAVNLASGQRKRILLIDLDLRKSDVARGLEISPRPGLGEFLGGTGSLKDIVRNTIVPGLYVIPGGRIIPDPSPLLAAEKIRDFLGKVRGQFDMILLDTPPILPVADTLSLRDQVDGFIFLFRVGFTPHHMFRQALEELGEASVLGVVLNGVEPPSVRYYHKYYGRYYHGNKSG
jgi:protein-tyrosine kinase